MRRCLGAELLEMIIRFYGRPMQALLSRYLEQAFTAMVRQQEAMQSEMAKALQTPFAPLTEIARKNMETVGADAGGDPRCIHGRALRRLNAELRHREPKTIKTAKKASDAHGHSQ